MINKLTQHEMKKHNIQPEQLEIFKRDVESKLEYHKNRAQSIKEQCNRKTSSTWSQKKRLKMLRRFEDANQVANLAQKQLEMLIVQKG